MSRSALCPHLPGSGSAIARSSGARHTEAWLTGGDADTRRNGSFIVGTEFDHRFPGGDQQRAVNLPFAGAGFFRAISRANSRNAGTAGEGELPDLGSAATDQTTTVSA